MYVHIESNTFVYQTYYYRSALRAIDDIRSAIEVYKEAEINRTTQTRDSIIPDTVNQVAE